MLLLALAFACTAPASPASAARLLPPAAFLPSAADEHPTDHALTALGPDAVPALVDVLGTPFGTQLRVTYDLLALAPQVSRTALQPRMGAVVTGDVTGDGLVDVVATGTPGTEVYGGTAGGLAEPLRLVGHVPNQGVGRPAVGDVDGDGVVDLARPTLQGGVWVTDVWRGGDTLRDAGPAWSVGSRLRDAGPRVALADLDGDGDADLAVLADNLLSVFPAEDGGLSPTGITLWNVPFGEGVELQAIPDMDGDGDAELAVTFSQLELHVPTRPVSGLVLLPGAPGFTAPEERWLPVPLPAEPIAAEDVDGDGHLDLIAAAPGRPGLLWLPGGPDGPQADDVHFASFPDQPGLRVLGALPGYAVVRWYAAPLTHTALSALSPGDEDADSDGFPARDDPDDSRAEAWPGAPEIFANGLDEDGDGWDSCGLDEDHDGFTQATHLRATAGLAAPSLEVDCDDHDVNVHPGALEPPGSPADLDCDGLLRCFGDADGDGYRGTDLLLPNDADCDDEGEAPHDAIVFFDCDDQDPEIYPLAYDVSGDGIDQDCDGLEDCYLDLDGDGARSDILTELLPAPFCREPYVRLKSAPLDCNDDVWETHPGAEDRRGDGVDSDCDGEDGAAGRGCSHAPGGGWVWVLLSWPSRRQPSRCASPRSARSTAPSAAGPIRRPLRTKSSGPHEACEVQIGDPRDSILQ